MKPSHQFDLDLLSVTIDLLDPSGSLTRLMEAMLTIESCLKTTQLSPPFEKKGGKRRSRPKTKQERDKRKRKERKKQLRKTKVKVKVRTRRDLYLRKFRSALKLIVDRFIGFPRLLLTDMVARIPEEHEVRDKLAEKGDMLSGLDAHRLRTVGDSNVAIPRFVNAMNDQFMWYYQTQRSNGVYPSPPGLVVIWAREFGKQKRRRHYHIVVIVNADNTWDPGEYYFPNEVGSHYDRLAYGWLTSAGLNRYEDNNPDPWYQRKLWPYLGSFIRFQGKQVKKNTKDDKAYKSRRISRTLNKKDLIWLYTKLSYMLKAETKAIPEHKREVTKETERTFGRSELMFTGLTVEEVRRKRRWLNTGRLKREKVPAISKNPS